jgi:hypothetical protein
MRVIHNRQDVLINEEISGLLGGGLDDEVIAE